MEQKSILHGDLIRRYDVCDRCSDYSVCQRTDINCPVSESPAVAAVPVSELIELRDLMYDEDAIQMRHLKMLNQLLYKYSNKTADL